MTTYFYSEVVQFKPHRLMIRPIEGHDVQLRQSGLSVSPGARVRWLRDVFGNSVAVAEFDEKASELKVESHLVVEQFNTNPFDFVLEPNALELPLEYSSHEMPDVEPFIQAQFPADRAAISDWIRPFLDIHRKARTVEFLTALNRSIPRFFQYERREEYGVQSPAKTLKDRSGSCRDFAVLFIEAVRLMGVAARFVSGYLCQPDKGEYAAALGSTHAWVEVYLPGAGWKGFDPTCGILAADHHVRVAVTRLPNQASPISGSFVGAEAVATGMEVDVKAVTLSDAS